MQILCAIRFRHTHKSTLKSSNTPYVEEVETLTLQNAFTLIKSASICIRLVKQRWELVGVLLFFAYCADDWNVNTTLECSFISLCQSYSICTYNDTFTLKSDFGSKWYLIRSLWHNCRVWLFLMVHLCAICKVIDMNEKIYGFTLWFFNAWSENFGVWSCKAGDDDCAKLGF